VLPTYHQEGFPMAVFQAVGAGRPVITTKIRAAADYFTEYRHCLWVEKKNPQQLYQQILTLLNDKTLQDEMKKNNLVLAEKFTAEKIVNKLLENFNKI
jgi:glycosyltransferase involved in cell wall biosynthesis